MARNDIFWGAFFASGDISYVDKIIAQLKYIDERKDIGLFLTAASAKWSLSSNSRNHPIIKTRLEAIKRDDDDKLRIVVEEILTKTPEQIQGETKVVINEQRKKGVWQ
ncbi:MAG: hypothetical protein ACYCZQ_15190 [Burkholderiales bacterium]